MLDHRHGDHIANVLTLQLVLEGHADEQTVLVEHRAPAVARVHRGVNLHRQESRGAVLVALDLDARPQARPR